MSKMTPLEQKSIADSNQESWEEFIESLYEELEQKQHEEQRIGEVDYDASV